jgi:hypothetical protein
MADPADELFGLAPGAFIAARDDLAKRLRAAGDKDAAAAVKVLRRPSVAAWAVNQIARDSPALVDAVIQAGAEVARAQRALLDGGDASDLRAATAARRDAVHAATRAAVALAGDAHREAVASTFEAAAGDAADEVRAGRLTRELTPGSSFSAGSAELTAREVPRPVDELEERRIAARAAALHRAEQAAAAAERAAEDLAEAERQHAEASEALERADAELRSARRRAEAAAEAAAEAKAAAEHK